jgi:hypothetical protein
MFHLFPDVCCNHFFYMDVTYVSYICYNSMVHLFQSYVAASGFMLQVAIVGCFLCSTHMLKCVFEMFHLFSCVCWIQMFLMLQVFYVVRLGRAEDERIGRATRWGPADGGATVLWWGQARGVLILASECRPCGERRGGQGRPAGAEMRAKCACGAGVTPRVL